MGGIQEKEIVEIAADVPGGKHAGSKGEFSAFGKLTLDLRQRHELYAGGQAQFRINAFPLGRDLFEPVCICDNVFLHGTDFSVQVRYFILPSQIHMNDGGLGIAVGSADKFVGSFCQQFQGMDDQPLQDKHVDKDRKDG